MSESTEPFTVDVRESEIHGRLVEVFAAWSKESCSFPAADLPALVAALAVLAAAESVEVSRA